MWLSPERLSVMTDRALIGCCYNEVRKYNKVNLIVYFYRYRRFEEQSEWNVVSKKKVQLKTGVNASGETPKQLNEFLGWGDLRKTEFINVLRFIDTFLYNR